MKLTSVIQKIYIALIGVLFLLPTQGRALPSMLVYGPTAGCFADSTPGYTVTVWDAATWATKTTADFAAFNVIVFGDCSGGSTSGACFSGTTVWAAAVANVGVWSPAVTGNVIAFGTDTDYHIVNSGVPVAVVQNFVNFAAGGVGTGLYAALSCDYAAAAPGTPVSFLSGIGSFLVRSNVADTVDIIAASPALIGVTSLMLSNWGNSVHNSFDSWPVDFVPLAMATDATTRSYTAPDGMTGAIYIVARGVTFIPTVTPTGTVPPTNTPTPSPTYTPTNTPTISSTATNTPTITPTYTPTCVIHVWPNPFNPFYARDNALKFSCLLPNDKVTLYTISGEKAGEAQVNGDFAEWKGMNKNGVPVSPGVYFYVIQRDEKVLDKGKILVIR